MESTTRFPPTLPQKGEGLGAEEFKSCCASLYEHPAVRWLLGGELHPGGERSTRRALELLDLGPGDRLLDIASGAGVSALLAAGESGCRVVGIEHGGRAVLGAQAAAEANGLADRVSFRRGDAEALPLPDGSFDAVLCECSLCTFPDKPRAVSEMRRALAPGGRLVVSDVVIDPARLPEPLLGPMATIACVGAALPREGYEELLADARLEVVAVEPRREDAAGFVLRIEERLRGAKLLGFEPIAAPLGTGEALELAAAARRAIADGSLSYEILVARRR